VSQAYVCSQCSGGIIQSKNCSNGGRDCICQRSGFTADYTVENTDFYLQKYNLSNGPWWQTIGGLTYATDGMTSKIPDTCTGNCWHNLMLALFADTNSAGIPIVDKLAIIITGVGVGGFYTEHPNTRRVQSEAGYTSTHQQFDAKPQENY